MSSSSIEMNNSVTVNSLLMKSLESATREYARKCVTSLATEYGFSEEDALKLLKLENLKLQVQEMKKRSGGKAKAKEAKEAKMKAEKPKKEKALFPLPFSKENVLESGCQGLCYDSGLFTQCPKTCIESLKYCKTCQSEIDQNGGTTNGTVAERLSCGLMEFKDPKGRKPVAYSKIMAKKNVSREQVEAEAGKLNIMIDEMHFVVGSSKKKKGEKKPEVVEDDLLANLLEELGAENSDEDVIDLEGEVAQKKQQQAEEKAQQQADEVALKKQQQAEEKALKDAEVALKKQQQAEEKALKDAEVALKKQQQAEEKALKDAEVALKKQQQAEEKALKDAEKAAKAQQIADEKAAKAQQIADEKAAKAQQIADEKAAKDAEKAAKAQQIADEKAALRSAKAQQIADEKAAKEAEKAQKIADEKAAKEQKIAEEKALKKQQQEEEKALKKKATSPEKKQKEGTRTIVATKANFKVGDKVKHNEQGVETIAIVTEVKMGKSFVEYNLRVVDDEREFVAPEGNIMTFKEPEPVAAPKKVTVKRITIGGKQYLKTVENLLYDPETKEEMGIYDPETDTIKELPDDSEDELSEDDMSDDE
jgi:hypothetical protein